MENKKILIIDDDPEIVKYLDKIFKNNGYDTLIANDGTEAEKIVQDIVPDLITLDLDMPSKWGPRFYRALTQKKETKNVPVIVISGLASGDHAIRNAVKFFSKPFNPDQLMETVHETIGYSA